MTDSGITVFFIELAILAILARLSGEIATRLLVPAVVGELCVGVILGPTVLKRLFPSFQAAIFPAQGDAHTALATVLGVAIICFLLAAGLEVDIRLVQRSGRMAVPISLCGVIAPFTIAFVPIFLNPGVLGIPYHGDKVILAMFIGACCSVTALPALSRILLDLGLFKTPFGMLIMSAAVMDDFVGWILVGIVLAAHQGRAADGATIERIALMVGQTVAFVVVLMTVGRWVCGRIIAAIYKLSTNPDRIICFIMAIGFMCAGCTASIGIHGLLGAFMAGVVIGSSDITDHTRHSIHEFVKSFFGPIYFAAVGLSVDFIGNFSLQTVLVVLLIACSGKILGCFIGAQSQRLPRSLSLGIGLAMNTRGSVEIVLATIGLQAGIIDEHIFVALTLMAVVTCCITGRTLRAMKDVLSETSSLEAVQTVVSPPSGLMPE